MFWALLCACAWVAMEMGAARILTGFPWNLLGASQYKILPLIQIASVTGVYGISCLLVWVSVSLACVALVAWRQRSAFLRASVTGLIVPLAVLFAVTAFGFRQLSLPPPKGRELKVALVQPSIPQFVIWDPAEKTNRFKKLVALSEEALAQQPDLLVWPEAALPNTNCAKSFVTREGPGRRVK